MDGFFYFDSPMNERLAHYLIEKELVCYAGTLLSRHEIQVVGFSKG